MEKKLLMKITFSIQASGSKFIKIAFKNKVNLSSIDCFLKEILLVLKNIASPLKPPSDDFYIGIVVEC